MVLCRAPAYARTFSHVIAKLAGEHTQEATLNQSGDEEAQQLAYKTGRHGHVVALQHRSEGARYCCQIALRIHTASPSPNLELGVQVLHVKERAVGLPPALHTACTRHAHMTRHNNRNVQTACPGLFAHLSYSNEKRTNTRACTSAC